MAAMVEVAGTLYCTLYCLIAFPPMHGHVMPVSYSIAWAAFTFMPWLLGFEFSKRALLLHRSRLTAAATIAGVLLASAGLVVLLEGWANRAFGVLSRPLFFRTADQLLPFLIIVAAMGLVAARMRTDGARSMPRDEAGDAGLPPADEIDWIKAAGNYVEVRAGARTLLRRLTMRQAEAALDPRRFVRIHRSTIVNRDRIANLHAGRAVQMRDGTQLRVGHAFRRNLDLLG